MDADRFNRTVMALRVILKQLRAARRLRLLLDAMRAD